MCSILLSIFSGWKFACIQSLTLSHPRKRINVCRLPIIDWLSIIHQNSLLKPSRYAAFNFRDFGYIWMKISIYLNIFKYISLKKLITQIECRIVEQLGINSALYPVLRKNGTLRSCGAALTLNFSGFIRQSVFAFVIEYIILETKGWLARDGTI